MKTPKELSEQLARQWERADLREQRLKNTADAWPVRLPIGKPSARTVEVTPQEVRDHIAAWRAVKIGRVEWTACKYRSIPESVELPLAWYLDRPSDWIQACAKPEVSAQYEALNQLCRETPEIDHLLWIRRRHLWIEKTVDEAIQASNLADELTPHCAAGRPLRALSYAGIDSKFFERHRRLIIALLDLRHDGSPSEQGLEHFLNAALGNDHWLLLIDLDGQLLPFNQQRVRASELTSLTSLPGSQVLLAENEQVLHSLPRTKGCIAILGFGLNLGWLKAEWFTEKKVAYWGDIDTWGLWMLAEARRNIPHLQALLMDATTFEKYQSSAVAEPNPTTPPSDGLTSSEMKLFKQLLTSKKGRLEQEFIPEKSVVTSLTKWTAS